MKMQENLSLSEVLMQMYIKSFKHLKDSIILQNIIDTQFVLNTVTKVTSRDIVTFEVQFTVDKATETHVTYGVFKAELDEAGHVFINCGPIVVYHGHVQHHCVNLVLHDKIPDTTDKHRKVLEHFNKWLCNYFHNICKQLEKVQNAA